MNPRGSDQFLNTFNYAWFKKKKNLESPTKSNYSDTFHPLLRWEMLTASLGARPTHPGPLGTSLGGTSATAQSGTPGVEPVPESLQPQDQTPDSQGRFQSSANSLRYEQSVHTAGLQGHHPRAAPTLPVSAFASTPPQELLIQRLT